MNGANRFDECLSSYLSASQRAAQIVGKMKTARLQKRKALLKELKDCDAERIKAIECMESEMGHH